MRCIETTRRCGSHWLLLGWVWAVAMHGDNVVVCAAELNVAVMRQQLIVAQEPAGALSPTATKHKLAATPLPAAGKPIVPQAVVVAGRIGARGMEPFLENKASFVLVEIPADDHAQKPGHDADNCPFCKKRTANSPMVAVQFVGDDKQPIPIDARKLFDVVKGQDVVISGMAVFDPKLAIPVIQLTANSIYVRGMAGR